MKIHEYQAKALFSEYGIPVPKGQAAFSLDEALAAASTLGAPPYVVKAQIHAGGRGKGGGVKVARSLEEVRGRAEEILGMTLVTHQTGPEGQKVLKLLIEEGLEIERELYWGSCWIGPGPVRPSWSARRVAWTSKRWPRRPRT